MVGSSVADGGHKCWLLPFCHAPPACRNQPSPQKSAVGFKNKAAHLFTTALIGHDLLHVVKIAPQYLSKHLQPPCHSSCIRSPSLP
jgi:hypothetical protein